MKPIIKAENLGKQYRIGEVVEQLGSLREVLSNAARLPLRMFQRSGTENDVSQFWALRDISFEVRPGEVLGIIGRNGSGKSTLLKILSRITDPSTGRVDLYGRAGSLLEVGTGFHPDLTGRENIYLNGAILGMTRSEISRYFDEMVAFAGTERFLDTPVKRYSSGMRMRLAFAVAAHLDPDILIVDEVLAVGDAAFQKKCLQKMERVAEGGRTVIFVSHDMSAVRRLTNRCLLLQSGSLVTSGPTGEVIDSYMTTLRESVSSEYEVDDTVRPHTHLPRDVEIVRVAMEGVRGEAIPADGDISLKVTVRCTRSVDSFRASVSVFRIDGWPVGSAFGPALGSMGRGDEATYRISLSDLRLEPGMYYCGVALDKGDGEGAAIHTGYDVVADVLHFTVMEGESASAVGSAVWADSVGAVRFPAARLSRVN